VSQSGPDAERADMEAELAAAALAVGSLLLYDSSRFPYKQAGFRPGSLILAPLRVIVSTWACTCHSTTFLHLLQQFSFIWTSTNIYTCST